MGFSSWLEIEPVSPVFIGCEEKIGRFETLVVQKIENQKLKKIMYILDFQKLLENDEFVERFVAEVANIADPNKKDETLSKILKDLKLDLSKVTLGSIEEPEKNVEMKRFIRSGGRYYVPGSSIKGALRTAIIKSRQTLVNLFDTEFKNILKKREEERQIKQYPRGDDQKRKGSEWRKKINEAEEVVFGKPQESIFRLLEISDSTFIDGKFLKFKLVKSKNLSQPAGKGEIPMMLELWLPDSDESNKVRVFYQFKADIMKILGDRIRNLGNLAETLANKDKLIEAMRIANKTLIDLELKRLGLSRKDDIAEELRNFYRDLLQQNEQLKDAFFLRIGAGTGFFSKTFFARTLSREERYFLRSFHRTMKVDRDPFPVSMCFTDYNGAKPMGWVKVSFVS